MVSLELFNERFMRDMGSKYYQRMTLCKAAYLSRYVRRSGGIG